MRARGTGRVYLQPGCKIFYCQYYFHGEKVRCSTGETDERKAEKFLKRKLAEVLTGTHKDTRRVTYEQLREAYYQDYATNGRKSLRHDREGNPRLDKVVRLDGFFEGFKANEIDADLIRKFKAGEQAKGLANASINRSLAALKRMFRLAKQGEKLSNVPHFQMLKEARPRQGFFEREQYDKLLRELPGYLRLPLAFGYFTGMREGEILAIDWDQVDLLGGVIRLRAGETKNDEAREVPVVPELRTLVIEQHAKRQPECPYVCFRLDRKGRAVQIRGFRKAWYSACVRCGLGKLEPKIDEHGKIEYQPLRGPRSKPVAKVEYRGMIFHDLRRSGVRNLVRAGVPEKVAMGISGHKTRSVFDRYNIVSERDVREAGQKLDAFHASAANFGHN
jgi:integrase